MVARSPRPTVFAAAVSTGVGVTAAMGLGVDGVVAIGVGPGETLLPPQLAKVMLAQIAVSSAAGLKRAVGEERPRAPTRSWRAVGSRAMVLAMVANRGGRLYPLPRPVIAGGSFERVEWARPSGTPTAFRTK